MDASMEVMWKRFASEEKCVMLVKSNEVTLTQQLAQNSILLTTDYNGFQQGVFQVYSLPIMARLTRCNNQISIPEVGSYLFLAISASEDNLTI